MATGSPGRPSLAWGGQTLSVEFFGRAGSLRDHTRSLRAADDSLLSLHGVAVLPSPVNPGLVIETSDDGIGGL
jgi:hypothetical protein